MCCVIWLHPRPPLCSPTTACDRLSNVTVSRLACCRGYAVSPSSDNDDFGFDFEYDRRSGGDRSYGNRGCPIGKRRAATNAVQNKYANITRIRMQLYAGNILLLKLSYHLVLKKNVVDCLGAQNLSDFKALLDTLPSLTSLLSNTAYHYTILAVANSPSIDSAVNSLLASDVSTRTKALSRQIMNGTVASKYLTHGRVYPSLLSSDNVHVTAVYARRSADQVSIRENAMLYGIFCFVAGRPQALVL